MDIYIVRPVGFDAFDDRVRRIKGKRVVLTQPRGCPRNGTMGHCYVADADTDEFYGLVLLNSLIPERR